MGLLRRICARIKRLFGKKDEIKLIDTSAREQEKATFICDLREKATNGKRNNNVETLKCVGDGLGIERVLLY